MFANAVISVAYLAISALIIVPTVRSGHLRTNRLAVATAAIFFSCSVGHGLHALEPLLAMARGETDSGQMNSWSLAIWHTLTAAVAIYYLTLRKLYGGLLNRSSLFQDLTEQKRLADLEELAALDAARNEAEAQRDKQTSMMQTMITNSQSIVYVKDLDGRYLMTTRLFDEFFELPHGAIVGNTDTFLGSRPKPFWLSDGLSTGLQRQEREDWWNGSAGPRCYHSVTFALQDGAGVLYATCGIAVDVTEKREAAKQAVERDAALAAAEAKSSFLATMSHEIRTPLNAVIGMTDLLSDTHLDGNQQELVHTVKASGDALLLLINDILDFSKIEAGEVHLNDAPFDIRGEAERSLDLVLAQATRKGLELACDVQADCHTWVSGDAQRFRQILVNLLTNAVKFTERGEIVLTVRLHSLPDDQLRVVASVADTGIGIAPDMVDRLFRPFSQVDASITRTYGGTGLGLAISRNLARAMGGELTLAASGPTGSTFGLDLMMPTAEIPGKDVEQVTAVIPYLVGRSALLIDDNETNLRILDAELTSLGMVCTTFQSPLSALAEVAKGLTYEVAIIDMHMPEMDGLALGNALKGMQHETAPLVLLTSLGWKPNGLERSFAAFLTKPAKKHALTQTLVDVLHGRTDRPRPITPECVAAKEPLRILLAEDNLINQRVAWLMLDKLGHRVDTVSNGCEAVNAAISQAYDIVLMDVQMPKMDGLEATRRIRAQLPDDQNPYIVALTANALLEDQQVCLAAGMQNYLSKPVRMHELEQVLNRSTIARRSVAGTTPLPAIDERVLQSLAQQLDDDQATDDLIEDYLVESRRHIDSLMDAVAEQEEYHIQSLAHTLRSTSELLGAKQLAVLLRRLELAADQPSAERALLARQVETEHARVVETLERHSSAAATER